MFFRFLRAVSRIEVNSPPVLQIGEQFVGEEGRAESRSQTKLLREAEQESGSDAGRTPLKRAGTMDITKAVSCLKITVLFPGTPPSMKRGALGVVDPFSPAALKTEMVLGTRLAEPLAHCVPPFYGRNSTAPLYQVQSERFLNLCLQSSGLPTNDSSP